MNERMLTILGRIEAKIDVLQLETTHLRRVKRFSRLLQALGANLEKCLEEFSAFVSV